MTAAAASAASRSRAHGFMFQRQKWAGSALFGVRGAGGAWGLEGGVQRSCGAVQQSAVVEEKNGRRGIVGRTSGAKWAYTLKGALPSGDAAAAAALERNPLCAASICVNTFDPDSQWSYRGSN